MKTYGIELETIVKSSRSGICGPKYNKAIENKQNWKEFWSAYNGARGSSDPLPKVDLEK